MYLICEYCLEQKKSITQLEAQKSVDRAGKVVWKNWWYRLIWSKMPTSVLLLRLDTSNEYSSRIEVN